MEHRNEAAEARKREQDAAKEQIRRRIDEEVSAAAAREEHMRQALLTLGEEQARVAQEAKHAAKLRRAEEQRLDLMRANELQQVRTVLLLLLFLLLRNNVGK